MGTSGGVMSDDESGDGNVEGDILVGVFYHQGLKKNYAIVPSSLIASQAKLLELRDFWGLAPPNFILETNTFERKNFNYAIMTKQDIEKNKNRSAESEEGDIDAKNEESIPFVEKETAPSMLRRVFLDPQDEIKRTDPESSKLDDNQQPDDSNSPKSLKLDGRPSIYDLKRMDEEGIQDHLKWMNIYVRRKIVQVLSAFVSAADMTGSWLLCHGAPSINEKLLEQAIDATRSSPVVLVVQDVQNLLNSKDMSKDKLSALKNHKGKSSAQSIRLLKQKTESMKLADAGIDFCDNKQQQFWERGTHFIFSENYKKFDASLLGPHGHICVNGASGKMADPKRTGGIIRDAVTSVKPCILFTNTGAETGMYARLILEIIKTRNKELDERKKLKSRKKKGLQKLWDNAKREPIPPETEVKPTEVDVLDDGQLEENNFYSMLRIQLRRQAWTLRKSANSGYEKEESHKDGLYVLTVADVLQVVDLFCNNHRLFERIVVPVHPLNQSPDSIVKILTLSFARSNMEAREVGSGDADISAVEQAWRIHKKLDTSKDRKNQSRTTLYFFFIFCGFLTTTVSIIPSITLQWSSGTNVEKQVVQWLALSLAATVTLTSGILNLTASDTKLAKIRTAQAKIVYQIFQFRLRAGRYSLSASERYQEQGITTATSDDAQSSRGRDTGLSQSTNISSAMHTSRQEFSRSLQHIVQELSSVDLHYEKLAEGDMKMEDRLELLVYVCKELGLDGDEHEMDLVALSGIMTSLDYYNLRVSPLLAYLENKEGKLRWRTRGLHILSMCLTIWSTILSAKNYIESIPIAVAAATGVFQILKVYDFERRFEISSKAARELRALDTFWRSLSDLDQSLRSSTLHMVNTCEQLALQFETDSVVTVDESALRPEINKQDPKQFKLGDFSNV